MTIHVCSLSRLEETVARSGASHVVTLINAQTPVARPAGIAPERHLFLGMNDIAAPMDGYVAPAEAHVDELLGFVRSWDRARPLVIHCWAGISRSTAAAYISVMALAPHRDPHATARDLRRLSPSATPNPRLVALADRRLGRGGTMIAAIEAIGRGADAYEGHPFAIDP